MGVSHMHSAYELAYERNFRVYFDWKLSVQYILSKVLLSQADAMIVSEK